MLRPKLKEIRGGDFSGTAEEKRQLLWRRIVTDFSPGGNRPRTCFLLLLSIKKCPHCNKEEASVLLTDEERGREGGKGRKNILELSAFNTEQPPKREEASLLVV